MPIDDTEGRAVQATLERLKRQAEHAIKFDTVPHSVAVLLHLSEGSSREALSARRILRSFTHGEPCVLRDDYPGLSASGRHALEVILESLNLHRGKVEDIRVAFDHPIAPPPPAPDSAIPERPESDGSAGPLTGDGEIVPFPPSPGSR